jgi:hypothetical protein
MGKYGQCAIHAVGIARQHEENPKTAWNKATLRVFPDRKAARDKGCPKGAFLGLCEEGLVRGIPRGRYTQSVLNKRYALDAVEVLISRPQLRADEDSLWNALPEHPFTPNGQMDVVIALWRNGMIVGSPEKGQEEGR